MLPSEDDIKELSASGDPFKYAVVGFSAIELALESLISNSLPTAHVVELRRASVELKVDIAVGLGLLPIESKGLFLKLSKIRNFYAHQFKPDTEPCTASELKSSFAPVQRGLAGDYFGAAGTFTETLRVAFVAAYYEVVGRIRRLQEKKAEREEFMLHVEALLAVTERPGSDSEGLRAAREQLAKRIEEKKDELRAVRNQAQPPKDPSR